MAAFLMARFDYCEVVKTRVDCRGKHLFAPTTFLVVLPVRYFLSVYLCRDRLAVWCGVRRVVGCLVGWSSFLICGTSPMPGSGGFERVGVVSWASSTWDCSCCCCLVWVRSKVFTASSRGVCGLSWSMIQFEFWMTRSPVARMVSSFASAQAAMYPVEYSAVSRPKCLLTR